MDRFSYEASFFDLRSQITDALNKCRFLRPIREVCGLHDTDLDLSEDEMTSAQVSSKYKQWCRRNHPDKHRDDMADEMKEAATKLIKEFGLVLQYPLENPSYFAFLKATEIMMQQIGKLLRSAKNKGKDHTDEVDDCLLRLQDVIRMAAFHNTAFYDGSIKESIEVTDEVRELLERLRTKLHYVRNFLELLEEDAFCKRHADVTGNEPNIFSGECVACCLERSGVLSSTVEIDREREDISAHLQTEGKVIVEVNSNTHQLIKCWLKAMEIDHNDCKIDFYDLLDEVVMDLKYKPFSYNLDNQCHDEIQRYKEKGQDYGRNTSCLLSVLSSVTEFSCHVYQVNKEGNLIDIWISAETPNHNRCVQLVYYRSRKSFDVVVSSTKYEEWLMRMEIDHNDKENVLESSSDTDESIDQQEEVVDCEEVDDLRIEDEPTRYIVMYLKKLREMPNFELNLLAATLEIVAEAEQSEDDVLMEVMKCKLRTCSIKILKEITSNCGIDCSTCVEKSDVIQEIVSYLTKAKYLPFSDEKNNLKRRFSEKVGNNTENINVKSRRPIDKKIFEGIEVIVAENLPFDIDNDTIYQLPIKTKDGKQLTPEDGRPFGKPVTCQTREFPQNRRRMQNCKGSHTCDNVNCNYLLEFGIENKVYFKNGKCKICSNEGIVMPCFARKLIEFGTEFVRVYHTGQHTCKAIPRQEMPAEVIELIRLHRRVKPRQVQRNIVLSAIEKGTMSKEELLGLTKNLNNKTKIENTKKKMKSKYRPEGHSFDALATFREKALKWDPFYIFEINNGKLNDKPSYVFKMSVATAKIALDMDKDRDSYLSEEWTFFDGTFKRCPGFVTLGAEMFHPLADRIIKLACMETDKEDTASIALFWRLFNRVLQQYSGNPEYKFNPSGLLCDELGSNWLGAESEFGPSIKNRSKSCAFHFKETIRNHSAKLSTEAEKNEFRRLGNEWLESATKSEYWKCFDNLMEFASMSDSRRKAVSYWVEWWHKRRSHLFKPFCPLYHAPRCNIGESQHAKYKMMDGVQLTLLDAAQDDIAEFLETEDLLKGLEDGTTPFTSTATSSATREKEYREQQARARAYGEDLRQRKDIPRESCSQSFVGDPTSTHRPDKHRNSRNRPAEDDDDNNIPHKKTRKSQEKRESVWRNTRSQVFEKSLHKAKTENIKLRSQEKRENERARKYVITNAKMDYHVVIGNNPSCSCLFQVSQVGHRNKTKQICKHILWVQLFVLCITESSPLLHQVSLTNSELTEIFDNAPLEIPHHLWKHSDNGEQNGTNLPQASSSKQSSRAGTTAYDPNATLTEAEELALFAAHPDNGKEQKWWVSIHKDETPLAKCASCKVPIIKDKCYIYVHALYRPRHCLFVKDRSFYFCALKGCIEKHQNFSNLISPPDEIEVDPCCSMTPELYSELERRKLPIV